LAEVGWTAWVRGRTRFEAWRKMLGVDGWWIRRVVRQCEGSLLREVGERCSGFTLCKVFENVWQVLED